MTLNKILEVLEDEMDSSKKLSAYYNTSFSSTAKEEAAYHTCRADTLAYAIRLIKHYYDDPETNK